MGGYKDEWVGGWVGGVGLLAHLENHLPLYVPLPLHKMTKNSPFWMLDFHSFSLKKRERVTQNKVAWMGDQKSCLGLGEPGVSFAEAGGEG